MVNDICSTLNRQYLNSQQVHTFIPLILPPNCLLISQPFLHPFPALIFLIRIPATQFTKPLQPECMPTPQAPGPHPHASPSHHLDFWATAALTSPTYICPACSTPYPSACSPRTELLHQSRCSAPMGSQKLWSSMWTRTLGFDGFGSSSGFGSSDGFGSSRGFGSSNGARRRWSRSPALTIDTAVVWGGGGVGDCDRRGSTVAMKNIAERNLAGSNVPIRSCCSRGRGTYSIDAAIIGLGCGSLAEPRC